MHRQKRQNQFEATLKFANLFAGFSKRNLSQVNEISKSRTVVALSLELICADREKVDPSKAGTGNSGHDGAVLWRTIISPSYDQLLIAAFIKGEKEKFGQRPVDMSAAGSKKAGLYPIGAYTQLGPDCGDGRFH